MNLEETRRKLVETYLRTGSISQTARLWGTSRAVVRGATAKEVCPVLGTAPVGLTVRPVALLEYNGRVERSHRTDDEEFYISFLGKVRTEKEFLRLAAGWVYCYSLYSLVRPYSGKGMEGRSPFLVLQEFGYALPQEFAVFPPLILDKISAD